MNTSIIQISPTLVEIYRSKREQHGWNHYKRLTPSSHNRLLYIAKKNAARVGVYAVHFTGEEVTTQHTHYTCYTVEI